MLSNKKECLKIYLHDVLSYTEEEVNAVINDIDYLNDEDLKEFNTIDGMEIIILTEVEAKELTKEHIKESLCYFRPEFLNKHIKELSLDDIKHLQELGYKSNNIIYNLLYSFNDLVDDAIDSDGYGSFLGSYDGDQFEWDNIILINQDDNNY